MSPSANDHCEHRGPDQLAGRLRLSTTRLARRLRQQSDIGLSPTLLAALSTICRSGPLTLGQLAEDEGVAPPTVTKIVAKLEGDDLVERLRDESDRRVCRVRATQSGHELLASSRDRKEAWLSQRLAEMDDDQRRRLTDAIDTLEALAAGDPP